MSKPLILIVDDEPDQQGSISFLVDSQEREVDIKVCHPREIIDQDLLKASAIFIDHYLEHWNELDSQIPSLRPIDGIALASCI